MESARLIEVDQAAFVAAALKQPSLFFRKPETLHGNVVEGARVMQVSETAFATAMLKRPSLFTLKPETLHGNVAESARLMRVSKASFVTAALKNPTLFSQKPKTLRTNVAEGARLMQVSEASFVIAALKNPTLFNLKPETLHGKVPYLVKIDEALGKSTPAPDLFLSFPSAAMSSTKRLHVRYILAKLHLKRGSYSNLITLSAARASPLILDHFKRRIAVTGKGARALQVMHAQGLIPTLPPDIPPITRPQRLHQLDVG